DVYRVSTGAYVNFLGYSDYMRSVAFSPDGTLIATGGDDVSKLGIARVSDWSDVRRVDSAHLPVADIAFSPNNQIVATTGEARTRHPPRAAVAARVDRARVDRARGGRRCRRRRAPTAAVGRSRGGGLAADLRIGGRLVLRLGRLRARSLPADLERIRQPVRD